MTRAIPRSAVNAIGRARAALQPPAATPSLGRSAWLAAAVASAGAGLIHVALGPAHIEELGGLGLGFFLAAGLQLGWAALAVGAIVGLGGRTRTRGLSVLARSGIAINVAILASWAVSRSVGLPAGAMPWMPEAVGVSDAVASVLEGSLVVGLVVSLRGWQPALAIRSRAMTFAAMALAMALISVGTVAAIQPAETAHPHGTEHSHGTEGASGSDDSSGGAPRAHAAEAPRDAAPPDDHAGVPEAAEVHAPH